MACLCRRTDFSKLSQTFLFVAVWNVSKIKITHLLSQHFLCLSSRQLAFGSGTQKLMKVFSSFLYIICESSVFEDWVCVKTFATNVLQKLIWVFKMARSFPEIIRTIVLFIFKLFGLKVNFSWYDFWISLF